MNRAKIEDLSDVEDQRLLNTDIAENNMKLSWHNLSYSVQANYSQQELMLKGISDKKYVKQILHNESGYVNHGEALFIMGASGAGKTSMLNALCDRLDANTNSTLSGEVLINDTLNVSQSTFGRYGAYVMQDDILFATFSCKECLYFSAKLRLGLSHEETEKRVNKTIKDLGLTKCQNTLVGNNIIRGLSGGEKKRTSIGVELITNPSIIFCDEPTSGLDSFNAEKIVKILVRQARLGKTVIATIHQPNSSTFQQFDRLLLLSEGHTIYQGSASESVDYFTAFGFKCPEYTNPSDYYLKVFSSSKCNHFAPNLTYFYRIANEEKETSQFEDKLKMLTSEYEKSLKPRIEAEDSDIKLVDITGSVLGSTFRSSNWLTEWWYLTKRTFMNQIRSPLYLRARIFSTLFMAFLVLSIFWDLGTDEEGIRGKIGLFFFFCTNQIFSAMFGVLMAFLNEREIFLREYSNRTYGVLSYFLAKNFVELPFLAIMPVIFSAITYFGVGLTEDIEKFWIFALIMVLLVYCSSSLGFLMGTAFTNATIALAMAPLVISPIIIFSGTFFDLDQAYVWLRWLQWISPIRYACEALMRNEFVGNSRYEVDVLSYIYPSFTLGKWNCILINGCLGVGFSMFSLIFLKLRVRKSQ